MNAEITIIEQLINADKNQSLMQALCELYYGQEESQVISDTLSSLHNDGKILLLSATSINSIDRLENNDFWSVQYILSSAIPKLKCETQELMVFVKTLVAKAGPDRAAGTPVVSLTEWCSQNPTQAMEIIEGARHLDENSLLYCANALKSTNRIDLMTEFANSDEDKLKIRGIQSLGLSVDKFSEPQIKNALNTCFEIINNSDDKEVRGASIESAFRLWNSKNITEHYLQDEFISAVISTSLEHERQQLLTGLFYHSEGLSGKSVIDILKSAKLPVKNAASQINILNMTLHGFDGRWDFDLVLEILDEHIPKLDKSFEAKNLYNFFALIWKNRSKTSRVISKWLNDGQFRICTMLADAINEVGGNDLEIELLREHIPSATVDQIFTARKAIGNLWHKEVTTASILFSLIKNGTKETRIEIEELLFDPLMVSYGGDLRDYVEKQKNNQSKRIKEAAERLLAKHDEYIANLNIPDDLVEFAPAIEQRRASAMRDHQRNRDIQKQAHERSVFAQIVTTETLLYGRKSFTTIHMGDGNTSSSVMPLHEFSYSTEIPRLSVIDPAGFNDMISTFRFERRVRS